MAVALQRFSIREYAEKTRAVDFCRCWPFGGDDEEQRFLPPMPVAKFRWWAEELAAVRQGAAEDDGENGKDSLSRMKQRTAKKKRSIAELFASSAQNKRRDNEAHLKKDNQFNREDQKGGKDIEKQIVSDGAIGGVDLKVRKRKLGVKEGCRRVDVAGNRMRSTAKQKTLKEIKMEMKRRRMVRSEISAEKKEKIHKLKVSSEANTSRVIKSNVGTKKLLKMHKVPVRNQKKKHLKVRSFLKEHILKLVHRSKLISRIQESRLRTILRKLRRESSSNSSKDKRSGNKKSSDIIESLCFNDKDGAKALRRKHLPLDLPCIQKLFEIISDVLTTSVTMGDSGKHIPNAKEAQALDQNEKETVTSALVASENSSEKEHVAIGDVSICSPITNRIPFPESVDLNHPLQGIDLNSFSSDCSILTPACAWLENPRVSAPCNEAVYDGCRETVPQNFSIASGSRYLGNCASNSGAQTSLFARNPVIQQSICFLDQSKNSKEEQPYLLVGLQNECNNCSQFQHVNSAFASRFTSSPSCASASENFGARQPMPPDHLQVWNERNIDEGFIGLPLNSQGELIHLHPESVYNQNSISKRPKTMFNSLQIVPSTSKAEPFRIHVDENRRLGCPMLYQNDQANWFLKHCRPDKTVMAPEFHPMEFQDALVRDRLDLNKTRSADFGKSPVEISHCGCRDSLYDGSGFHTVKFQSNRGLDLGLQPAGQPTVRLMGKNVTVAGSYKESEVSTSRSAWTEERRVNQGCPMTPFNQSTSRSAWAEVDVASSRVPFHSSMLPASYNTKLVEPISNCMHLQFGPQALAKDGNHASSSNDVFRVDLFRAPAASQTYPDKVPRTNAYCNKEIDPIERQNLKTYWTSYPQNVYEHMHPSSAHGKHSQGTLYGMSSCDPPFTDQTSRISTQTPIASSSQNLPHWLMNSRNQHSSYISYHPVTVQPPCAVKTSTVLPFAPPYPRTTVSYPYLNGNVSHSYNSPTAVSVVYPSVAGLTEIRPTVLKTTRADNTTGNNGMEIDFGHAKGQNYAKKSRKRPPTKDVKAAETVKRANFEVQDYRIPAQAVQTEKSENTVRNKEATQPHYLLNPTITPNFSSSGIRIGSAIASSESSPVKPSTPARSGPVKLAAGAKHILRPSGSTDQDNLRTIHSTVPFSEGTNAGLGKAATVFRF